MTKIIDRNILLPYIEKGLITERKHPSYDIFIYNYTQKCSYGRYWDNITLMCRGLILSSGGEIISNPFPKFFNVEELESPNLPDIPLEPFQVYEKLDGSLGILYKTPYGFRISSRGAFASPQADVGSDMLYRHLEQHGNHFQDDLTYLFEIIYPDNKIVIDYGNRAEIVLLAVRETDTGKELPIESFLHLGFTIAKRYDGIKDYTRLKNLFSAEGKEGFVILFEGGMRMKIKFEEYIRLHKLLSGLTKRTVWECLSAGQNVDDFLKDFPDEEYIKIHAAEKKFLNKYLEIETTCKEQFRNDFPDRKSAAKYILTCKYPSILFKMLDGKDYSDIIWKMLEPGGDEKL